MKTRQVSTTDASVIAAFVSAIATEHIASSLGDGGLDKLLDSMNTNSTKRRIADGWPHFCVFDTEDDLAAVLVIKPPTHLYHLFVRTDLHRTGIGAKLLESADDWSINSTGVRLATVNSSLNAVQVYHRLGFETHGPILDSDGIRYQPMVRQND